MFGQSYLEHALRAIGEFLTWPKTVHFAPYALKDRNGYTDRVQTALGQFSVSVVGLHTTPNPAAAVEQAEVLFVGGATVSAF